ncbi:helix-turn-helix domain-containing protein [Pseudopedobacter beijingensis]|uniref:Helix-turn-helix domain-containing protein n=1 Tax=Pseudopedobacter beijingensis TaxID=1207056 RepID=A0ABW4IAS9_9SPHI
MDWILFLNAFTIVNKLVLFSLFWFKKNNSASNRFLSVLILFSAIPVLSNYIIYTGGVKNFPHLIFIYQIFGNMVGPVFYFYCMEMIGRPFVFNKNKLLHLIPAVFPVIFWIDFLLLSEPEKHSFVIHYLDPDFLNWRMLVASVTPPLFALPYFIYTSQIVFKYVASVKEVYTNVEKLKINYIKQFVGLMLAELFTLFVCYIVFPIEDVEMIWLPILNNIYYFYIIYKAYNYALIFSEEDYRKYQQLYQPLNDFVRAEKKDKYASSGLSQEKIAMYAVILQKGFNEEKWYLDPELNLKTVSVKAEIPIHYISQIINQKFEKNFFDYVNSYRVEELKLKLADLSQNKFTIEGLAYMSGFNSKAAFQRVFKKNIGMSPREYRKTCMDN